MIPLKLTLSGIYSFRENKQTIDFKRLTQESLFGIFGKVGSGKSTILEAIIFALYSKSERMGGRDYLYNMMNLSSNESYIDFEFEAGEMEYRSIVKLKRNSKNFENVTTPKRELYEKENGEWVALDLKDDANKMENIIGLSYENFRKVIIIPQGAFKDFLEMSSGDRTEMFSKIFPELKRYDLSAKAGSLLSETREKRTFITGQLEQLSAVSEEEVEQETIKLNQLSDALKVNGQQLEKCKQQTLKMDRLKGLVDRYMVCVAEQQKLEADKEVITKMAEQLKEYNECVHIFGEDIKQRNNIIKRRNEIKESLKKAEEDYLKAKHKSEEILTEYENCEKEYGRIGEYNKEIEQLRKILSVRVLEKEIVRLNDGKAQLDNEIKDIEQKISDADMQKASLLAEYTTLKEITLPADQLMKLHEWYTLYHKLLDDLSDNEQKQEKLLLADNELTKQLSALVLGRSYLKNCSVDLNEVRLYLTKEIDRIELEIKSINEKLNSLRVQQELYHYSTTLHDGEPCPLCGSVHHPNIATSSVEVEIAKLNSIMDSFEKEKDNLYHKALVWVDKNVEAQNERNAQKKELAIKKADINNGIAAHVALFVWQGFTYNDSDYRLKIAEENAKINNLNKLLDNINSKEKALTLHRNKREECNKQLQEITTLLLPKQTILQQNKADIDTDMWQQCQTLNDATIDQMVDNKSCTIKKIENNYILLKNKKEEIHAITNKLEGEKGVLESQNTIVKEDLEQINSDLGSKVQDSRFESLEYVEMVIMKNLNANHIQGRIDEFREKYNAIVSQKSELEKEIDGETYNPEAHAESIATLKVMEQENQRILQQQAVATKNIERLKESLAKKQQLEAGDKVLEQREMNLNTLCGLFRGGGFMKYVSGMYLENLVNNANVRFKEMTSQQLAIVTNENEELDVRDSLNQGKTRSIKTLSGGQKFQASLALALALVDSVQCLANNTKKFFFLDEGFGTQDKDSLEVIFNTLKSLGKENRVVGIISHVEELKQNIPTYITMKNYEEKGSIIERY